MPGAAMSREDAQAALEKALKQGMPDLGLLDLWLHYGADINTRMDNGDTMLIRAAHANYLSFVEFLLARRADVHATNPLDGRTALLQPAWIGHTDVVHRLLAAGADPEARTFAGDTVFSRMKPSNPCGGMLLDAIAAKHRSRKAMDAKKQVEQAQEHGAEMLRRLDRRSAKSRRYRFGK